MHQTSPMATHAMIQARLAHIPQDIAFEILLRLPVKSLLRFKSAGKSWLALITSKDFVEAYHKRANIRCAQIESPGSAFISLYTMDCDASNCEVVELDNDTFNANILGSCNGLLLIEANDDQDYLLWNPTLNKCMKIAYNPSLKGLEIEYEFFISGLGYSSTIDDYKAIVATKYVSPPCGPCSPLREFENIYEAISIFVYNFKHNSWSTMDGEKFPYTFYSSTRSVGVTLNGAPHWVVRRCMLRTEYVIVYFDLVKEKFREVQLPNWLPVYAKFELGILEGCLCITHNSKGSSETWAMREYGVKESWSKLFVISQSFGSLIPMCFTRNGDVTMVVNGRKLIIFNLKENTQRLISLSYGYQKCLNVATYVESLIFPKAHDDEKKNKRKRSHLGLLMKHTHAYESE